MSAFALLLFVSFNARADFGFCAWSLDVWSTGVPAPIPNPEFENPESEKLRPTETGPDIPAETPVIDPGPAPVDQPLPAPEPLERPPDEK